MNKILLHSDDIEEISIPETNNKWIWYLVALFVLTGLIYLNNHNNYE